MKVTVLGCGTSGGVPKVPKLWGDCDPENPKNRRSRASILIETAQKKVVIDTTPDFRAQMLAAKVGRLDAVFYTHDHADHVHGIDDIRGYFHKQQSQIPLYSDMSTLKAIEARFDYIFTDKGGYPAIGRACVIDGPTTLGDLTILPFEQGHGSGTSLGYRFGNIAYSTDLDRMTEAGYEALDGVEVWIVDALRYRPHPTHAHLAKTLEWINRVRPERAILTHMNWDMDYETLKSELPTGVEPAFDGMTVTV